MPLNKSSGNMYEFCTHTHTHIGGECPHQCGYCMIDNPLFGRPKKYQGKLRLIEPEFKVKYGKGRTIFIENCNDLFAEAVPDLFIIRVLKHCKEWPDNHYVLQSKNPRRMVLWQGHPDLPPKVIWGTTAETNREVTFSKAPHPLERLKEFANLLPRKFVTIEPVLDFDVHEFATAVVKANPTWVNIGADSKGHDIAEPTKEKILTLIDIFKAFGVEVRRKTNLARIIGK